MPEPEEWRPIADFPHYLVSSWGNIKHVNRNDPRTIKCNRNGFPVVLLSDANTATRWLRQVNVLVAQAFLRPPLYTDETTVWHRDGDLSNCHVENLKWERRDRVLEWNRMHRTGRPEFATPAVKNNRSGEIYRDAYDCAIHEGMLESDIVWRIEKQNSSVYDENNRYRYVPDSEIERNLR